MTEDDQVFRRPTLLERQRVLRLINGPEPSQHKRREELRGELRKQVDDGLVRPKGEPDSLEFQRGLASNRSHHPELEGRTWDTDGTPIDIILFVTQDDLIYMMEVVCYGDEIRHIPPPSEWRVWFSQDEDTANPPWPDSQGRPRSWTKEDAGR